MREAWKPHSIYAGKPPREIPKSTVFYKADDRYAPSNTPWVPSIHMPRWASRITLAVTEVRVERLQDITAEGEIAEGIEPQPFHDGRFIIAGDGWSYPSAVKAYAALWNSLHGDGAWDANPWVAVIRFVPTLRNIDAPEGDRG